MTPAALLQHLDDAQLWAPGTRGDVATGAPADLAVAYQQALAVRALRIARGERPAGYKIGFTNRTIWQRYGVFAPIWGTVWDSTLVRSDGSDGSSSDGSDGSASVSLAGTCQPRLEPEIVFGIAATPPAGATLQQLFDCVDWLAPGFEIVQSHCADWKFSAAETVADGALHARLLVGATQPVRKVADSAAQLDRLLAAARVQLWRGDERIDQGVGAHVLDGPLHALHHFVLEMQACPGAPALQPGDVVTTGTWTDAWPLLPGQRWRATFDAPLGALHIALT